MSLDLENLNDANAAEVRKLMLDELERDIADSTLYYGARLTPYGRGRWQSWLREGFSRGTADSLASALQHPDALTSEGARISKTGREYETRSRWTAAQTLAYGEFNRFYIRGVCRLAEARGITEIEVYRALDVESPRDESEQRIGSRCSASDLLQDLRHIKGQKTRLGIPSGPDSGLSVRLPR